MCLRGTQIHNHHSLWPGADGVRYLPIAPSGGIDRCFVYRNLCIQTPFWLLREVCCGIMKQQLQPKTCASSPRYSCTQCQDALNAIIQSRGAGGFVGFSTFDWICTTFSIAAVVMVVVEMRVSRHLHQQSANAAVVLVLQRVGVCMRAAVFRVPHPQLLRQCFHTLP